MDWNDKARGPDGVHPMVLRECAEAVAKPLAMIYQKSFDEGVVPENWKEANVSPIFKKGRTADAGNYRPVSLTSVSCTIMESIVRDTLLHYFEKQDLLTSCQHGFRKG